MTRPDLHSLLDRVRSAEKGSRELDWLVADAFGEVPAHTIRPVGWDYDWYRSSEAVWALRRVIDGEGRSVEMWQPQQRSTSLDAVITLVRRELPGWAYRLMNYGWGKAHATLIECDEEGWHRSHIRRVEARNLISPPLALLAALLQALIEVKTDA